MNIKSFIIHILIAIVLVAVIFLALMFMIRMYMYDDGQYKIRNVSVSQDEFSLDIQWSEEDCKGYNIVLFSGIGKPYSVDVEENHCKIQNIKIPEKYTVIVTALDEDGNMAGAAKKKFRTKPIPQKIQIKQKAFEGFTGDKFPIYATAEGEISFKSSSNRILQIDEDGLMTFGKPGQAKVTIIAEKTEEYRPAKATVSINVYPDKLKTPEFKAENLTDTTVDLKWKPVPMADEYVLYKYDVANDKYKKLKTFDADENETTIVRDQAKYKVRAQAVVNDKEVKSDKSKAVSVKSTAASAKTYSSSHTIMKLNSSTLTRVATITGTGGINVPQSMSFNGKEYIVSYVNQSGSAGALLAYDRDGNYVRGERVSGMGYANGSTYNPNTGNIYVVKTHQGYKTNSCSRYSEKKLKGKGSFNLPRVTSGIAYDESNNKFYLSKGNEIYVTDTDFKVEKFIWKKIRYNHAQDIGAYNGVVLVCTWVNGNTSYIDMYRASDGAYLGSYDASIGEIESVVVDDGYLVVLMNTRGSSKDFIYRTKERIAIP